MEGTEQTMTTATATPTAKQVAENAAVGINTASRILNGYDYGVTDQTRQRVIDGWTALGGDPAAIPERGTYRPWPETGANRTPTEEKAFKTRQRAAHRERDKLIDKAALASLTVDDLERRLAELTPTCAHPWRGKIGKLFTQDTYEQREGRARKMQPVRDQLDRWVDDQVPDEARDQPTFYKVDPCKFCGEEITDARSPIVNAHQECRDKAATEAKAAKPAWSKQSDKPCACGCGEHFTKTTYSQRYKAGHR